ncbi:hypothetical protein [Amycolatopsis minnesotensis]|uniref:DUF1540 domain-containing protein n=1 Tax=Amycolatopsis minnesotensis TaxID=337894 RepID=A0ABP5E9B5_9PSEU
MDCLTCGNGLDHCHGTLVVHVGGALDCTDANCADLDRVRHTLIVDCEFLGACDCHVPDRAEPLRRAS